MLPPYKRIRGSGKPVHPRLMRWPIILVFPGIAQALSQNTSISKAKARVVTQPMASSLSVKKCEHRRIYFMALLQTKLESLLSPLLDICKNDSPLWARMLKTCGICMASVPECRIFCILSNSSLSLHHSKNICKVLSQSVKSSRRSIVLINFSKTLKEKSSLTLRQ